MQIAQKLTDSHVLADCGQDASDLPDMVLRKPAISAKEAGKRAAQKIIQAVDKIREDHSN